MHTEDETQTKWCPFGRAVIVTDDDKREVLNSTSFNRTGVENQSPQIPSWPRPCACIASECMAWRWLAWRCEEGCGNIDQGKIKDEFIEPCDPPKHPEYYSHIGYCGLAGKP